MCIRNHSDRIVRTESKNKIDQTKIATRRKHFSSLLVNNEPKRARRPARGRVQITDGASGADNLALQSREITTLSGRVATNKMSNVREQKARSVRKTNRSRNKKEKKINPQNNGHNDKATMEEANSGPGNLMRGR